MNDIKDLLQMSPSMRPPSWRWCIVLDYLVNHKKPIRGLHKDEYLGKAIKFYRERKFYSKNLGHYLKYYPIITKAFHIYNHNKPNGWRWVIEALSLTKASNEDICKLLELPEEFTPEVIDAYKKLFFDVDEYKESEAAVIANLLGTSPSAPVTFQNYDYVWKRFAYTFGAEAFIEYFGSSTVTPKEEHNDWLKELARTTLSNLALEVMHDRYMCYSEIGIKLLTVAKEFWTISNVGENTTQDALMGSFLNKMGGVLELGIMNAKTKPEAIEYQKGFDYSLVAGQEEVDVAAQVVPE